MYCLVGHTLSFCHGNSINPGDSPHLFRKNHKYKYEVNRASSANTKLKLTTGRSFRATIGLLTTSSAEVTEPRSW
jgi:hypothetical protein